VKGSV